LQIAINRFETSQGDIGYRLNHRFNKNWSFRNQFRATFYETNGREVFAIFNGLEADNRTVTRSANESRLSGERYTLQTDINGKAQTGIINHNLLFGLELERGIFNSRFIDATDTPSIDLFEPEYGNLPLFETSEPSVEDTTTSHTIGLYAQDLLSIGKRVKLLLGGRFDWSFEDFEDKLEESSTYSEESAFSPRVTPVGERVAIETIIANAQAILPNAKLTRLILPASLNKPITTLWIGQDDKLAALSMNPYTGEAIAQPVHNAESYRDLLFKIHIELLSGEWGHYLAGMVGLLATIVCVTGIILWLGWRKLATGFKIKWNARIKRLNFDLHKVAGIITAVFLTMAMFTGFIWNFATWIDPILYAVTASPKPPEAVPLVSKSIAGQAPLPFTETLLQKINAVLPDNQEATIFFPSKPEETIEVWGAKVIYLDRFSGEILKIGENGTPTQPSRADLLFDWFMSVHFGTFAGLYSRIFYLFVGLAPAILLTTGFIMWWYRKPIKRIEQENCS
jgi:uncharacterized iron-regulated membrane protein